MTRAMKVCVLSLALSAGLCRASWVPPTDEDVGMAIASFTESTKDLKRDAEGAAARREAAGRTLDLVGTSELTVGQIEQLNTARIFQTAGRTEEASARLGALARDKTADGARAAVLRLGFLPSAYVPPQSKDDAALAKAAKARESQREALQVAVNHPGLADALGAGQATSIFDSLAYAVDEQVVRDLAPQVLALGELVTPAYPADKLPSVVNFYESLMNAADAVDAKGRERVRVRLTNLVRTAAAGVDTGDEAGKKLHTRLKRAESFLDGAYARGDLVGHPAPEIHFTWTNAKEPIKTLADLRGKVVVLDFWATWCGPCIGSFPDVRKLAAHYEGYPVAIVGVTSLQGYHISRPEGLKGKTERIETKDEPEKEYGLMPEFIGQMDMTWTVAFGAEEVFNPDYGVRGIPHVAIIDPAGVVRYRGIHPSSSVTPFGDKTGKIDSLLKEFNLPVPPPAEDPTEKK